MKWFRFPFAVTGTRTAVPEDLQPSGDVSYEEGYGADYSRDPVLDPLAKRVERDKYNQLLYDITNWIREFTIIGTPDFITTAQNGGAPYSYQAGARVMFDDGGGYVRWESLVGTNTSSPLSDPTKWRKVGKQGTETLMGIFKVATQAQALARTDDTVVMTPAKMGDAGAARARVSFLGAGAVNDPMTILDSFNVSSVVKKANGRYQITFTNPLPNPNYCVLAGNTAEFGGTNGAIYSSAGATGSPSDKTVNTVTIVFGTGSSPAINVGEGNVVIF